MKKINFDPLIERIDRGVGQMRLVRTDPLDTITDFEPPEFFREMYHSKDKVKVIYASVLKAAFLQRRVCFLLSRNELHKLVRSDADNRYKSVNEDDYRKFFLHIVGNNILKYIFEPSDLSGMAALVGFDHEIVDGLTQLEELEYYKDQIENAKEIYKKKLEKLNRLEEKKQRQRELRKQRKNKRKNKGTIHE